MDLPSFIRQTAREGTEIKTIEMHTTGEPTRIVYSGYPDLQGTLLEQRGWAQSRRDNIRRALIYEPRGHKEMYGAVLRPNTELVESGHAHMGILFLTNEGYSTMCGHATLAVARLLVDIAGSGTDSAKLISLPGPRQLTVDWDRREVHVSLHVPCGLVHVTVPVIKVPSFGENEGSNTNWRTDPTRPISYLSVPSYATGINVTVPIPSHLAWPELGKSDSVMVDIAYGGAFYIVVSPAALGFSKSLARPDLLGLSVATKRLKKAFNASESLRTFYLQPAEHPDLEFLYGTIVTDSDLGEPVPGTTGAETSLCFFSNAQVDRSPTGSGVQAKVALAYTKGRRALDEKWTYHSLVSNQYSNMHRTEEWEKSEPTEQVNDVNGVEGFRGGEGAFVGEVVEKVKVGGKPAVIVKVKGFAMYTGMSCFVVEEGDDIGEGFWFEGMGLDG